jgi:hypothetical protein
MAEMSAIGASSGAGPAKRKNVFLVARERKASPDPLETGRSNLLSIKNIDYFAFLVFASSMPSGHGRKCPSTCR